MWSVTKTSCDAGTITNQWGKKRVTFNLLNFTNPRLQRIGLGHDDSVAASRMVTPLIGGIKIAVLLGPTM
jgi:hypothetical protein